MPAPHIRLHCLPAGTWIDYHGIPMMLMTATQVELTEWSWDALQERLEHDKKDCLHSANRPFFCPPEPLNCSQQGCEAPAP